MRCFMARLQDVTLEDHRPNGADVQLQVALDNMPGALVYTDEDLNIVICNDRFKEMYRVPEELLQAGRPYPDFLRYLAEHGYYGEGEVDALVAQRVDSLRNPSGRSFEDHAPDGRWYRKSRLNRIWRRRRPSSVWRSATCRARSSTRIKISTSSSAMTVSKRCTTRRGSYFSRDVLIPISCATSP